MFLFYLQIIIYISSPYVCTYIELVMRDRKQSGQNGIELTAEKIILTIPYFAATAADDDNKTEGELQKVAAEVNKMLKIYDMKISTVSAD